MLRVLGDFGDMKAAVVEDRWLVTDEEAVTEVGTLVRPVEESGAAGYEWRESDEQAGFPELEGPRAAADEEDEYFDDQEDDDDEDDDFYDDDLDDDDADDDDDDFDDEEPLEDD